MKRLFTKIFALIMSVCLFVSVVFERYVNAQGMSSTSGLASMGGTMLTGIGVSGLMSHTGPCLSDGVDCDKLAMDLAMTAGGIMAMLAAQNTGNSSTGNFNGGLDNYNYNGNGNYNYNGNYNFNSNFNTNFNSNSNNYGTDPDLNNFNTNNNNSYFCTGTKCSIPSPIYDGIEKYIEGLSSGSIAPPDGMSPDDAINMARTNLDKLEDAVSRLQMEVQEDVDDKSGLTNVGEIRPNFGPYSYEGDGAGDSSSTNTNQNQFNYNGLSPVSLNGLNVEDVFAGKKLSLFDRATRRYKGNAEGNRSFEMAQLEEYRKRANKKSLRKPASVPTTSIKANSPRL